MRQGQRLGKETLGFRVIPKVDMDLSSEALKVAQLIAKQSAYHQ